jgi:hypothetical protein
MVEKALGEVAGHATWEILAISDRPHVKKEWRNSVAEGWKNEPKIGQERREIDKFTEAMRRAGRPVHPTRERGGGTVQAKGAYPTVWMDEVGASGHRWGWDGMVEDVARLCVLRRKNLDMTANDMGRIQAEPLVAWIGDHPEGMSQGFLAEVMGVPTYKLWIVPLTLWNVSQYKLIEAQS